MAAPTVYNAIHAVAKDLSSVGIAKTHENVVEEYLYRSIDDVLDRLSPLLSKHRLCVLPQVRARTATERNGTAGDLLINVVVHVAYSLVSVDDGSVHIVDAFGEALDPGDKATAKAMAAAFKTAMLQTFCVPVTASDDPDASTHRLSQRTHDPEPVQGWEQWSRDVADMVAVCESKQAIELLQDRHRKLLVALSRERPDLYAELGTAFTARLQMLGQSRGSSKRTHRAVAKQPPRQVDLQHA